MSAQGASGLSCRSRMVGPSCVLVCVLLSAAAVGAAEPQSPEALIQAWIQAGEFAPALAAARSVPNLPRRDALLGQIAVAQAQAGVRQASLNTAAEIRSDRARAQTLSQIQNQPLGSSGGGSMADFDSLIDLIQNTVAPDSWLDAGGAGTIEPFPTGVDVNPQGVLRPLVRPEAAGELAALRRSSAPGGLRGKARQASPLRKVSLTRLEKQVQLRLAAGRLPTEEMQVLAGLQRVRYLFLYPKSGDVVLAGPAGNWRPGPENRVVSAETGRPVVRLDDLVVVLRQAMTAPDGRFGCMITPRQEGLARVQEFLARPMPPGGRKAWIEQLRAQLGRQDIEVYGLDPRTPAARVLVEADYRMKLVGMGLEEGVPGVESYLNLVKVPPGKTPPPFGVIRWWFTLNYDAVLTSAGRRAFALRGQGVKVLSENEKLTAEGKRLHTGQSEPWTRRFAESFTEQFEAMCEKYPIYADLRNVFDLALVAALIRQEKMPEKADWHLTCFGDGGSYPVALGAAPRSVDSVVNYRVIQDPAFHLVHTVVGVSGGVRCDPVALVAGAAVTAENDGALGKQQSGAVPGQLPGDAWWWD